MFQLKRLLVNLLTRRKHLIKSIRTGMGRFRHPSYHLELLTLEKHILFVQQEICKKQEEAESVPKLPIERFLEGQASNYNQALRELRKGKRSAIGCGTYSRSFVFWGIANVRVIMGLPIWMRRKRIARTRFCTNVTLRAVML